MNNEAQAKLRKFLSSMGVAVCNTPRSCEMFLLSELADYPDDRDLLIKGLRGGIVTRMLAREGSQPWEDLAPLLAQDLQKGAALSEDEAHWVVESWGLALGKHPHSGPIKPQVEAWTEQAMKEREKKVEETAKMGAFLPIVAGGGALGSALGAGLVAWLWMLFMGVGAEFSFRAASAQSRLYAKSGKAAPKVEDLRTGWEIATLLIVLANAGIGMVAGGLGAAGGWLIGKGDRRPWHGFSATFSAGFFLGAIAGKFLPLIGPGIACFLGCFASSMSVAYGTARE